MDLAETSQLIRELLRLIKKLNHAIASVPSFVQILRLSSNMNY